MATLETLPAELRLLILSLLTAKQIQKCRAISRSFRDLINLEDNRSLCLASGMLRSHARIEEAIEKLCHYPISTIDDEGRYTAHLDAFGAFACTFGHESGSDSIRVFARHFRRRVFRDHSVPAYVKRLVGESHEPKDLICLLNQISSLHWCFHGKHGQTQESGNRSIECRFATPDDHVPRVMYWWTGIFNISRADAEDMLKRIKDGVLIGASSSSTIEEDSNAHILDYSDQTSNTLVSQSQRPSAAQRWSELQESNRFTIRVLDLPIIPDSMRVAYSVHTQSALEAMRNAAENQQLPLIIEAAVLEEIGLALPDLN